MIKLFIVDDESIIRKGLRFFIDWEKYNVEVVGEAANGHEALQSAVRLHPDIVLTDIRMPKMDGLELVSELKRILPETKIIMLSGHNDTEYFTRAISLGVSEFILKSADSSGVISAVEKVALQISTERKKELETRDISQLFDDNYQHLAARYMKDLLEEPNVDIVKRNIVDMKMEIGGPYYCILHIGNTETREEQNSIMSVLHFCLSLFSPLITCFNKSVICLLNCNEQHIPVSHYKGIFERLAIKHLPIIVSDGFTELFMVKELYRKSTEIRARSCWYPDEKMLFIQEIQLQDIELCTLIDFENQIVASLEKNVSTTATERLNDYFTMLTINTVPLETIIESFKRIVACICYYQSEYDSLALYLNLIENSNSPHKMLETVATLLYKDTCDKPRCAIVRKAIELIEEGYVEKITLSLLAKKTFVSISYLSKVFSDEMGIGVRQYINKVRVEKSKELIQKDELKIFEIASAVGFRDYKQLATYFHRFENMSITEYKRSIM